jgi:hypothetical protein
MQAHLASGPQAQCHQWAAATTAACKGSSLVSDCLANIANKQDCGLTLVAAVSVGDCGCMCRGSSVCTPPPPPLSVCSPPPSSPPSWAPTRTCAPYNPAHAYPTTTYPNSSKTKAKIYRVEAVDLLVKPLPHCPPPSAPALPNTTCPHPYRNNKPHPTKDNT